MPRKKRILLSLLVLEQIHVGHASILSTAAIDVRNFANPSQSYTLFASQGEFGRYPKMTANKNAPMSAFLSPEDDPLLCNEADGVADYSTPNSKYSQQKTVLVVPRGSCSFEKKALAAQRLGASAIIIYGNLASRYSVNSTTQEIIFPKPFHDYDCNLTSSYIPENILSFDPLPYNSQINDPLLSGSDADGNWCAKDHSNFIQQCPSQKCLLTGVKKNILTSSSSTTASYMQACCAWDTYLWLYADSTIDNRTSDSLISIQAFYITIEAATILLQTMQSVPSQYLTLTLYARYAPDSSLSSVVIWLLGIFVAALAAYLSASDIRLASDHYRLTSSKLSSSDHETSSSTWKRVHTVNMEEDDEENHNQDEEDSKTSSSLSIHDQDDPNKRQNISTPSSTPNTQSQVHTTTTSDTVEMTAATAVAFMILSTFSLLIIFYFKIYAIVKILYALGSGSALAQVLFIPFFASLLAKWNIRDKGYCYIPVLDIGSVDRSEMIAYLVAFSLSLSWLTVSFILPHPGEEFFFWFLQDVIGICMCITFLKAIQINSIKVATILLVIAFVYDIFFVFISPYLTSGGKSIMIDVATSGGPPQVDPSWCEKYPLSTECKGGDPLPVLLTIPRFDDYRGGSALLGLGDILLPGLLLSFAARYDEAKKYIGLVNGGRGQVYSPNTCPELDTCSKYSCLNRFCMGGYFYPLVLSYAVGLSMANIAVNVMKMGQPALLYLVPCCLGTICVLGWRRGELRNIWETPRVLQLTYEYLQSHEKPLDSSSSLGGSDTQPTTENKNDAERVEVQSPLLKIS